MTVPSALSYRYYGADEFVMGAETFIRDTGTDSVMYYAFDTTDEANSAMEAFLKDYTENENPHFDYERKATYTGEFESRAPGFGPPSSEILESLWTQGLTALSLSPVTGQKTTLTTCLTTIGKLHNRV